MFNVFAGARRVAALVSVIAVIVTVSLAVTSKPYVSLDYAVFGPGLQPVKTTDECPSDAAKRYTSRSVAGNTVYIHLCLMAANFGKERLIPYSKDEKGVLWGAATYSGEVEFYGSTLEKSFQIPAQDAREVDTELTRKYWSNLKEAMLALGIGLAIFWAVVWGIGWIVRGFLGIPPGKDRRDPAAS